MSRTTAVVLGSVMAATLVVSGCTREPTERERSGVTTWLTCVECGPAELEFVVDSLGPTIIPMLEDALTGLDPLYRENLTYQFEVAYDRLPSAAFTREAYVERFLTNFETMVQRRAAVALGELGASDVLSRALDDSIQNGFRPDVIQAIRRALVRADAPQIAASAATVEVVPGDIAIEEAATATLRAVVRDANGTEVPTSVTWSSANAAIATVTPGPDQTAEVTGVAAGSTTVTVTTIDGDQASVTVTVMDSAPADRLLVYVSGSLQSGPINSVLPDSLVVRVTDLSGTEQRGVTVDWRFPDGRGTFTSTNADAAQTVTGPAGTASVQVRLGSTRGLVTVEATIGGTPVTFRLRAN